MRTTDRAVSGADFSEEARVWQNVLASQSPTRCANWLRSARVELASFGARRMRARHTLRRSPKPTPASFGARETGFVRREWLRSALAMLARSAQDDAAPWAPQPDYPIANGFVRRPENWLRLAREELASLGANGFVRREWLRSARMASFGAMDNGFVRRESPRSAHNLLLRPLVTSHFPARSGLPKNSPSPESHPHHRRGSDRCSVNPATFARIPGHAGNLESDPWFVTLLLFPRSAWEREEYS
jgi:hypothetical protein